MNYQQIGPDDLDILLNELNPQRLRLADSDEAGWFYKYVNAAGEIDTIWVAPMRLSGSEFESLADLAYS